MLTLFLIAHFTGLCIGVGAALSNALLSYHLTRNNSADIPADTKRTIAHYLFQLGTMGLTLLVISGILLILVEHPLISLSLLFWLKLFVVSVLVALVYYAKQLFNESPPNPRTVILLTRSRIFSPVLSLLIVILAVLAFQ